MDCPTTAAINQNEDDNDINDLKLLPKNDDDNDGDVYDVNSDGFQVEYSNSSGNKWNDSSNDSTTLVVFIKTLEIEVVDCVETVMKWKGNRM